jgi:hypothetical protein
MESNERLRWFIESIFTDAPQNKNVNELKEEILLNLTDKYEDFIARGKSEETAYNLTVASLGNINELISDMGARASGYEGISQEIKAEKEQLRQRSATFNAIAAFLYILSIIPVIIYSNDRQGIVATIIIIGIATALLIYNRVNRPKYEKFSSSSILDAINDWQRNAKNRKQLAGTIISVLWLLTVIMYFVISFATGLWHITWMIFIVTTIFNIILGYILK